MRHFLVFSHTPYLEMRRNRKQHALVLGKQTETPVFIREDRRKTGEDDLILLMSCMREI